MLFRSVPQVLINREHLPHMTFDIELLGYSDTIVAELCHQLGVEWEQSVGVASGDGTFEVPVWEPVECAAGTCTCVAVPPFLPSCCCRDITRETCASLPWSHLEGQQARPHPPCDL